MQSETKSERRFVSSHYSFLGRVCMCHSIQFNILIHVEHNELALQTHMLYLK